MQTPAPSLANTTSVTTSRTDPSRWPEAVTHCPDCGAQVRIGLTATPVGTRPDGALVIALRATTGIGPHPCRAGADPDRQPR